MTVPGVLSLAQSGSAGTADGPQGSLRTATVSFSSPDGQGEITGDQGESTNLFEAESQGEKKEADLVDARSALG
jgi:hypothetical protein